MICDDGLAAANLDEVWCGPHVSDTFPPSYRLDPIVNSIVDTPALGGDEVLRRIEQRRGAVLPVHNLMAELDPQFLDLFDEMYCHTLGVDPVPADGRLSASYRELICACACAVANAPVTTIARHLRRALDLGLTEQEAIDGFHALLIPCGGLAVAAGVRAMMLLRDQAAEA
ncbi:carboxymuconolactone decarboxylase family protein [Dactylosporangium sp. CA-152071]|uniref:carboxymuconolactone decarboxylase family protein n=1 Tax=Dactylosporangium sp. CA-152071 TaxID=3239933 RepID=UPI003D92D694